MSMSVQPSSGKAIPSGAEISADEDDPMVTLPNLIGRGALQLRSGREIDRSQLLQAMEAEFPRKRRGGYSTQDLDHIALPRRQPENHPPRLFDPMTPVEIFGADATWRKGRVTRVVEQVKDEFDWENNDVPEASDYNVFYNVGDFKMLNEEDLSLPMEFLVKEFGLRPFVWQQWAMLRLEDRIRFQQYHPRDFEELDATQFGKLCWQYWLAHPANADFKALWENHPFKNYLLDRVIHPFNLVDAQTDEYADWNISNAESISVYAYLSFLGSGTLVCAIILFIQISLPVSLYILSLQSQDGREFWEEGFCTGNGGIISKTILLAVMLIYLIKVTPKELMNFLRTAGAIENAVSRTISLRRTVWTQGDDTLTMRFGYALNVTMNTAYASLVYGLNIFILFNTTDATDILLNALAIEFIAELDEEIAAADWWDPERRYIQAGTVELTIRSTLRMHLLEDYREFCRVFEIDENDYQNALSDFRNLSLVDEQIAHRDAHDVEYAIDEEDSWWIQLTELASETGNNRAFDFFKGKNTSFSSVNFRSIYRKIRRLIVSEREDLPGPDVIFGRFYASYCWSKWERVMFLPSLPGSRKLKGKRSSYKVSSVLHRPVLHDAGVRAMMDDDGDDAAITADVEPDESQTTFMGRLRSVLNDRVYRTLQEISVVLSFQSFVVSIYNSVKRKERFGVLFSILYGVIEWLAYVRQTSWPRFPSLLRTCLTDALLLFFFSFFSFLHSSSTSPSRC